MEDSSTRVVSAGPGPAALTAALAAKEAGLAPQKGESWVPARAPCVRATDGT